MVCQVVTIKELPFIYTTLVSETSRGICEVHLNRLPCSKSNASGGLYLCHNLVTVLSRPCYLWVVCEMD